jgi:hypothetical protein
VQQGQEVPQLPLSHDNRSTLQGNPDESVAKSPKGVNQRQNGVEGGEYVSNFDKLAIIKTDKTERVTVGDQFGALGKQTNAVDTTYLDEHRNPNLDAKQKRIEQVMVNRLKAKPQKYINEYISRNTNQDGVTTINIDTARDLFPEYKDNKDFRAKNTDTTSTASSYIAYEAYQQKLAQLADNGESGEVVFTGGIPAAGMSEALKYAGLFDNVKLIYDSNLSSFNAAKDIIDQALEANQTPQVFYVHRDPIEAFESATKRAIEAGRSVNPNTVTNNYLRSGDTVRQIIDTYGDKVNITIIDNDVSGDSKKIIPPDDFYGKLVHNKEELDSAFNEIRSKYNDEWKENDQGGSQAVSRGTSGESNKKSQDSA